MPNAFTRVSLLFVIILFMLGGCSAPDIDATLWRCESQADCGDGFVCAQALGACVVPDNSAAGVSSDKITLGMSAALSAGPNSAGVALKEGVEAHIAEINAAGGIDGRLIELLILDDAGDPDSALSNIQDMVNSGDVFAVLGGGVADSRVAEFMVEQQSIFFASTSGDPDLYRDPPDRYIFHLRQSATDDLNVLLNYATTLHSERIPTNNIALFAETRGSSLAPAGEIGDAVLSSFIDGAASNLTVLTHPQDSLDVDDAIGASLRWMANQRERGDNNEVNVAFMLASHAAPTAAFVRELLDEFHKIKRGTSSGLEFDLTQEEVEELLNVNEVLFLSPSSIDSDKLSTDLKNFGTYLTLAGDRSYCGSVVASRVVPSIASGANVILNYKDALAVHKPGVAATHLGLEGYIAARVLIEALRRNGPAISTENVINELEDMELDLGLGTPIDFAPSDRVAFDQIRGVGFAGNACQEEALDLNLPAENNDTPNNESDCEGGVCILTGTVTENLTLSANNRYLLRGSVFIGDGGSETVLTIEPGTTILGESSTTGTLIIRRGAQIVANGTREAPIVFTSSNAPGERAPGDWGGVIINGRAPINGCDEPPCEAFGEGGTGFFGGDDPEDNSGVLRYIRIEFAGKLLSPDNELNGLALQGVGRGTVVEFIQVHRGADDGVEFFGGTVNFKYILTTAIEDDNLDWVLGWQGKGQYFIAQQWPGFGDNGIEADNNGGDNAALPRSKPTLCNLSLVGSPESEKSDYGMLIREGTAANISSAIMVGWNDACFNLDQAETFNNAATSLEPLTLSGELTVENSIFDCAVAFEEDNEDLPDPFPVSTFITEANSGNRLIASDLSDPFNLVAADFAPNSGSPATTGGSCPNDPFFDDVDFIGGMDPNDDWTLGWTTNVEN